MKYALTTLAVLCGVLCEGETVQALGRPGAHHRGHAHAHAHARHHHHAAHVRNGHAARHFHVYHGRHQRFWTQSRMDARYGGSIYLAPGGSVWYYYAPLDDCYYPTMYWPMGVYTSSR